MKKKGKKRISLTDEFLDRLIKNEIRIVECPNDLRVVRSGNSIEIGCVQVIVESEMFEVVPENLVIPLWDMQIESLEARQYFNDKMK